MDVDSPTTTPTPPKKHATPSASAESASRHPSMSLAQDIHRLTMIHAGKLSVDEATTIIGMSPDQLLDRVQRTILSGDKTIQEAIDHSASRIALLTSGDIPSIDDDDGPLLNATLYNSLAATLSFPPLSPADTALIEKHHESALESLQEIITKASEESGDMEVLAAKLSLARYTTKSLSCDSAIQAYQTVLDSPKLSTGKKIDAHLEVARVYSFYGDVSSTKTTLKSASETIAKGGDWDRRNRLKAYTALSMISVRDLEEANKLLMEGIATFSCEELCEYTEFCVYAVVMAVMYASRVELKKGVIDGSEILGVAKEIPVVIQLANTLYECNYKAFLSTLVAIQPHLIANRYLQPHSGYILRELHILAYRQFLDSYQSVTLDSMAASFGVSSSFLDGQLSRFIASGRLTAKIDNVGGIVETMKTDWKNARYREMIVKGDALLNRIQKLGRVVDL
ncbi:hypothetical protein ACHAWO_004555 [Cyclotella atomus]|uniref:PCI domain-containing protein n=1 Tax=Cyclotella atomus TaxID=382360 RepID=A0ABD3NLQ3_9STRA